MTEPGPRDAVPDPAPHLVRFLALDGAEDKAAFMERCAVDLELPEWFGRNWDALADCLADPGPRPGAGPGLVIVVTGWQAFADRRPREWETARDVFTEAVRRRRGSEAALTVALGLG